MSLAKRRLYIARVLYCADGDTMIVIIQGNKYSIRIAHIDAPESGQHYARAAKEGLEMLCKGLEIEVIPCTFDRYGRAVCNCFRKDDGLDIGKEMLRAGMAWHEKKYSRSIEHAIIEAESRVKREGLWKDCRPIAPWRWRQTGGNIRQTSVKEFKRYREEMEEIFEWLEKIYVNAGGNMDEL